MYGQGNSGPAREISKIRWQAAVRNDYASVIDGQRYILALDRATQATVLKPVTVVGMPANRK